MGILNVMAAIKNGGVPELPNELKSDRLKVIASEYMKKIVYAEAPQTRLHWKQQAEIWSDDISQQTNPYHLFLLNNEERDTQAYRDLQIDMMEVTAMMSLFSTMLEKINE